MFIGRIFLLTIVLHLFATYTTSTTINIAARSGGFETLCRSNLVPFYNKTGIAVNIFAFDEADLRSEMLSDLKKGSPYYDGYVGPASEFYNLIICTDCQPEQRPLIQSLSEWVREDADMAWYDIATYERTITTVYKGEIYTVPLDADAMLLYYREDILEQAGFHEPPDTWEEYIQVSQALQNLDMNSDGVPDYATCTGKTNSSKFDLNAYFFMSYVAPYLQYNGTHQGVFFDAETMAPMSNTTAFGHVWSLYKEITRYGPERETDIWTSWDLFAAGRCAMVLTFGDILGIIKNTSVSNVTSSTILPGTREVYNRKTQQMEQCTADLCPFMDHKGINRAPFATPGYTGFVSRFTRDDRKKATYDFLSFLSQPAQSQVGVFEGLGQDIFRKSQLNATLWFDSGFSNITTVNTIDTLRAVLESPNVAIPMPAIQQYEYFTAFTNWNKCYLFDECTLEEAQAGLTHDWVALLDQYGLRDQHTLYAVMLGNPEPVYSYQVNMSYGIMVAFISVATFIIGVALFFLFFVVKCRHYKLIRATQPTFHYGTIVGAIAMLIGVILVNIQPPANDYCTAAIWLILMGFSLLHANLSAKMFRIWRLSDVKSLEIRVIKDIHLVPFVAGIVALYIVPLAVWTALEPPDLHPYTTNLPPDQYMMICGTSSTGVTIFIVLLALSCALLLVGCVFAYLNRNVATIYNESRQVAASIYTFSFAAIVLVPMIFTISDYMVVHTTLSAVICFCILVTLVSLFLFKLLRIIRKGDKTPNGKSSQSMHHTSSFTEQSNQLNELKIEVEKLLKENNELRNEINTLKKDTCHQSA